MKEFINTLASKEPTPGGGGAAALVGTVAAALCSMVANLTTGKKKYEQYQEDIDRILAYLEEAIWDINSYIEKYSNIKLFEIDNSKLNITGIEKASNNRLNLLKHAKGEYICFLDGDDFYIDNNRHQIMVDFLDDNPEYIAAFHDFVYFNHKEKTYKDSKSQENNPKEFQPQDYIKTHQSFCCFVYRNIFKNANTMDCNLDVINDSTFTYYFLRYGKFFFIAQKMYAYRINIESIFFNQNELTQLLYTFLCAELNQKLLPQYEKELCKKHKKLYQKKSLIKKIKKDELEKIKNFAKKQNCYFTYNLIDYQNLNLFQKIKLNLYKNIFINFKKDLSLNKKRIKNLSYFNSLANFGDELNLYILQRIFNLDIKYSPYKKGNLVCIGSILEQIITKKSKIKKGEIKVWGSGFIKEQENKKEFFKKQTEILALRGELTKQRVEKIIGKKLDCPLGDPGLLACKLLEKIPNKEHEIGIILHYVDKNSSFLKNIKLDNYILIDVTKNPIHIINEIAKCEVILSSAMHGLIVADSLNIPNQWIKMSDLLYGKEYKFNDYYSIFNHKPKAIDLREEIITLKTVEEIKNNYQKLNFKEKIIRINENLLKVGKKI